MSSSCFTPKSVLTCYSCLINHNCKDIYLLKEQLELKALNECINSDSNCKKCLDKSTCELLKDELKHRYVKIR